MTSLIVLFLALCAGLLLGTSPNVKQNAGTELPTATSNEVSQSIAPGLVTPAVPPGSFGALAGLAARYVALGITFHAPALDFSEMNPSGGSQRDRAANSPFVIEGVDADLGGYFGLTGLSLRNENIFSRRPRSSRTSITGGPDA